MTPRALHAPARLAGTPLLRTQTDQRLVDLVRVGNDGAFEAIVARYRRPLLRYCSGLLPEGRAEDVVQQSFLRAYDALRASEGEMALRPWLYRIAHNQSLNALRDRSLGHEELSEGIDGVERPDQAFEKHERLRDTVAAVSALPERQRNAIVLRELEGRSYDEIATELGVTGGAVRQLLNRARGTLRAGMTAVTPYALMARMPWATEGGEGMAARLTELCGAGAGGAVVAKVCATALVTGAVVGGVATSPDGGPADGRAGARPSEAAAQGEPGGGGSTTTLGVEGQGADAGGGDANRRGSGSGGDEDKDDRSGRRGGEDRDDDRSGPGGGDPDDDSSGHRGGEPDDDSSSGPGSGDATEELRSDSSGPGGGGGSGSSGSGSSGSGKSGSGSSGSGSSGSSGPGSGSDEPELEAPEPVEA